MSELDKRLQFETICRTCEKELQNFIYTLIRYDPFAMEEIYQNTMLAALKALPGLREGKKMKSWIFSIAKSEARRYYSPHRNFTRFEGGERRDPGFLTGKTPDFTNQVADADLVRSLISGLSKEEQQICILYYSYGLTLKKVSVLLRRNYSTVRSLHTRGLKKLREMQHLEDIKHSPFL